MRFLIIFIFLITNVVAEELPGIKNIVIHKIPKTYDNVIFLDKKDQKININKYKGNLLILNFWATWCEPCKEEMPSLDKLAVDQNFKNLGVLAINIGQERVNKIEEFYKIIKIENLDIFYDTDVRLAKKFLLRGVPTTLIINKDGKEIARVVGSLDFQDNKFKTWLKNYD